MERHPNVRLRVTERPVNDVGRDTGEEFDIGMQLPQWLARFNRHVTNPIQRLWAGRIPAHGILEHVGRRSGKSYRTPLGCSAPTPVDSRGWRYC